MADTRLNGSYADGYVDNLALTVAVLAPTPGALRDSTAPTLSRFGASRRRFAVARAGASKKKRKVPRGTTLRLRLSENASVTVTVQRPQSGRRSGKRCVAPRKGLRKKKKCTRYVSVGSTSYNGHQGDNRFAFSGRLGRRALRPGRYRLSARGKDAAGNISAPKNLTITIIRA